MLSRALDRLKQDLDWVEPLPSPIAAVTEEAGHGR